MLGDERVKCWRASRVDATDDTAGTVLSADRDGIVVACSSGAVAMQELQRPGKGRVSAREFAAQTRVHGAVLA
jgi:methionyl-tRNA formyltransferase